ncbi:MAG: guanylate kinase [Corynebacterium sp.]|nr:guanylate kinase [Corynebacterium sp.]
MTDDARRGRLVVLSGPSAVGKSTVVARLREEIPDLYFSVSMTTREPRPGEVDGRDYFFVSKQEFQDHIDRGEMLEWADIHHGLQRSGTPRGPVEAARDEGHPVLVEVDLAGMRSIRALIPEAATVFLAPPSWEELVRRLTSRGTESDEVVARRLETAREEMDAQSEYDAVIVNDDLEPAVTRLVEFVKSGPRLP